MTTNTDESRDVLAAFCRRISGEVRDAREDLARAVLTVGHEMSDRDALEVAAAMASALAFIDRLHVDLECEVGWALGIAAQGEAA